MRFDPACWRLNFGSTGGAAQLRLSAPFLEHSPGLPGNGQSGGPNVQVCYTDFECSIRAITRNWLKASVAESVVKYQACWATLDELASTPIAERSPCPMCGSLSRHIEITIEATVTLHSQIALKARRHGKGRLFLESKVGDDLYHLTGRWNRLERHIDHENDWYDEVITDSATGEILKETHEPLSQHQGHGSAKRSGPG